MHGDKLRRQQRKDSTVRASSKLVFHYIHVVATIDSSGNIKPLLGAVAQEKIYERTMLVLDVRAHLRRAFDQIT